MSRRTSQQTYAAFCEEFDEDANEALPETRKVANVAAKRSKPDLKPPETIDIASDSGYSSRTAATGGSGESLAVGTGNNNSFSSSENTVTSRDFARPRGREKTRTASLRGKEKEAQEHRSTSRRGTMEASVQRPSSRPAPQRSSSKSRNWEATSGRHPPGTCYECDQLGYHNGVPMSPVDTRQMDYSPYIHQPAYPYDVPQSPRTPRYPPVVTQETRPSPGGGAQTRPHRSNSYHAQNRPVSFHAGVMPDMSMAYMPPMSPAGYEHGPPLSASAYANSPSYYPSYMGSASGMPPPSPYEQPPQPKYDRPRASSTSRSSEKSSRRRSSNAYGPPVVDYANSPSSYYTEAHERKPSRESRARRQSQSYEHDEDYYLMPPPPAPPPKKKSTQEIPIPKRPTPRKSSITNAPPTIHRPPPFDLSDLRTALPPRTGRRPSRDRSSPERVPSAAGRNPGRTTSYQDPERAARVSVEGSRNRRSSVYGLEQAEPKDFEQKQREAEEYQAARTPRSSAFSLENIMKARHSQRAESDSDSQKSRSDSSRGSDTKTKGSGMTSRQDDDSITMIIRGVKIGLSGDSVEGKKINVRSGEEGGVELNIEGRRPRKYIMSRSDSISTASRKEIEDVRRTRDHTRSERASRRSSRSGYSGRGLLE